MKIRPINTSIRTIPSGFNCFIEEAKTTPIIIARKFVPNDRYSRYEHDQAFKCRGKQTRVDSTQRPKKREESHDFSSAVPNTRQHTHYKERVTASRKTPLVHFALCAISQTTADLGLLVGSKQIDKWPCEISIMAWPFVE